VSDKEGNKISDSLQGGAMGAAAGILEISDLTSANYV
jgi:hypothetical protein